MVSFAYLDNELIYCALPFLIPVPSDAALLVKPGLFEICILNDSVMASLPSSLIS